MSKQIDELMGLARQWVEARTKDHGGSPQQDALRQALEAALKPGGLVAFVGGQRKGWTYLAGRVNLTPGTPLYTTAPPAQTPPPRLTDEQIKGLLPKNGSWFDFAHAIETAVRKQFGVQE